MEDGYRQSVGLRFRPRRPLGLLGVDGNTVGPMGGILAVLVVTLATMPFLEGFVSAAEGRQAELALAGCTNMTFVVAV